MDEGTIHRGALRGVRRHGISVIDMLVLVQIPRHGAKVERFENPGWPLPAIALRLNYIERVKRVECRIEHIRYSKNSSRNYQEGQRPSATGPRIPLVIYVALYAVRCAICSRSETITICISLAREMIFCAGSLLNTAAHLRSRGRVI